MRVWYNLSLGEIMPEISRLFGVVNENCREG